MKNKGHPRTRFCFTNEARHECSHLRFIWGVHGVHGRVGGGAYAVVRGVEGRDLSPVFVHSRNSVIIDDRKGHSVRDEGHFVFREGMVQPKHLL